MKTCTKCGVEKPLYEFYNRRGKVKDGKNSHCKSCENEQIGSWRAKNKEKQAVIDRRTRLKTQYGITPEQYEELLVKQNHNCAICLRPASQFKTRLAVDHDHTTGLIRGLLCIFCNREVISRHRDPELLQRASNYLRQNTGWKVPEKKKRSATTRRRRRNSV